ncbi:dihydrolipoyl dehydrogenase family protein [Desulfogranum japonicum]|uniref:dihydrolipoyl dehydrogenase family protein n=1 Tax=Desulfogranum japonicum TaxID=231447 RepID=UPI0004277F5A|nr:FAD-dependent oxidoreductase [Desulfogranum japonicum]
MARFDYDIGIIGAGAAGLTIASGSAQLGARTLLIEKEPQLGGDCLHYGCVPSKTLIQSAKIYHQAQHTHRYGLPRASIEAVNMQHINQRIQEVIQTIQHHDSVERFCGLGAHVRFGSPRFTDEHCIDLGGQKISARKWVIATGSSPAKPVVKSLESIPYITNKDLFSLPSLPDSMIVLGAGPIAIEMAQAFSRLGSKITVVQRSGQILSKEDKDLADILQKKLEQEGIRFYLNASVVDAGQANNQSWIEISQDKNERKRLEAAEVLLAQGREVNIRELGLSNIGVLYDQHGIRVDRRMRTSQKHIFAAGDVTGTYQFTHAAGYEGSIVVSNAIFHLPRKVNYTWMPWCTYSAPELASIGMNEKRAQAAGIDYTVLTEQFSNNDRAQAEGQTVGSLKLLLNKKKTPLAYKSLAPMQVNSSLSG